MCKPFAHALGFLSNIKDHFKEGVQTMRTVKRNGIIDLMRFVFCIVIVVFHSRNLGASNNPLFAEAGYLCVEFFFIVSGFLMAKTALTMQKNEPLGVETVQFLWKKIRSILPYFLLAVFFSYGSKVILNGYSLSETVRNFMLGIWDLTFLNASGLNGFRLIRATWYLSAMYLGMLLLFPMIRKWKTTFTHIIAPLISIFLLAYLFNTKNSLDQYINNWKLLYPGLIRAVAELSLGCICYIICERVKSASYTNFSRILFTLVQVLGYGFVIYCMHNMPSGKNFEYILIPIIAACVILSFSGQGIGAPFFTGKFFPWLGKMSLIIYLNHMWVKDTLAAVLPKALGYWKLLGICLVCVFVVSWCSLFFVDMIGRICEKHKTKIRHLFIKE